MQGIAQKVLADPGKYSIQQLQQGVQNGIIPAYIAIPIIQAKVQEQKQAQAMQAMQQPPAAQEPPVASRVMSEARGLEALPSNLPAQYAGGGIVAFDEGGSVPRYNGTATSLVDTPDTRSWLERLLYSNITPAEKARIDRLNAEAAVRRGVPATPAAAPVDLGPVPGTSDSTGILGASKAPVVARPDASGLGLGGASALGRGPGLGLKAPTFPALSGESYETGAKKFYEDYETKAEALDKKTEEAIKQANESVKGKAFDEYKKSLEAEALQAGADKDQAKYMSLFKAGLAMMAGTSRHAFENIGKGAMVGAEDYQAATKDLRKAEKERRKEFALIEQAQRAEALGDRDKAIANLEKARDRADTRTRYIGEGIYKATNLDRQQAYDIAKTQFASTSDIFRTDLAGQYQLAAADRSAEAKLAAALARGEGRGQMNQKQIGDALIQLQSSPEAIEYRKRLLKEKGERAANTPEFKAAMDQFVNGLFQKYYGGAPRSSSVQSSALEQLMSDPSVAKYLNP